MTLLRILAVGDIHLGRRPGSVPADVAEAAGGLDAIGPREAWARTVEAAIEHRVQAVLLLGDVVDDEERYLEAWSALETGLRRLLDADIEVFAVAGNHDVRVLPRLARTLDGLRLLGEGGRWESAVLAGGSARLVGWSYPTAHARTDPTHDPALLELCATPFAGPTLGLLHGDLDAGRSEYANFSSRRLRELGADAWLLGHVHAPSFARADEGGVALGYLGSLTGLDPNETGVHGPWLIALEGRRIVEARQLPLAPLRWERIVLPVDAWSSAEELEPGMTAALLEFEQRERARLSAARACGVRIELAGRSPFHRALRARCDALDLSALRPAPAGRLFFVDAIRDRARPALDLGRLARSADPSGLLARRLLALDAPAGDAAAQAERARLTQVARAAWSTAARRSEFSALGRAEPSDEEIAEELRAAGLVALEELVASRGGEEGA